MTDIIDKLQQSLDGCTKLLIIPHNDPDPDAIASALGLHYFVTTKYGIETRIGYRGIIGRAENKALVRYLNYPLQKLDLNEIQRDTAIALVDTQPGAGNNPLPTDFPATIVIDHHAWQDTSISAQFIDIRPEIGATSSILTEYIQAAGLDFTTSLATALFYGIKADTMGLGRSASSVDVAAYLFLQSKVDIEALSQIEHAQVSLTYFMSLDKALHTTHLYDNDLVISNIGILQYPDLGAEIADLLSRLQDVNWVVCMGVYEDELILSVRSRSPRHDAGNLAHTIIGDLGTAGGHGTMAGGQILLNKKNPNELSDQLVRITLQHIKGDASLVGNQLV
jgi:nanoRNase/pAp phosphatase (c-di-AMP/oligoRNAs hydrolase)